MAALGVPASEAELRAKYPSDLEGSSSEEDDSIKRKKAKRQMSASAVAFRNAEQSGLHGREPLKLEKTASHCLVVGQTFV
jgi:hypothetical protein